MSSTIYEDIVENDLGIDIVHRYRNVRDYSAQLRCVCPFCGRETLSVNAKTGKNYCWSANCTYHGAGGGFHALYAECNGISRDEAKAELRGKIPISEFLGTVARTEIEDLDLDAELVESFDAFDRFGDSTRWKIEPGCKGWGYYGKWIRDTRGYDPEWFFNKFEAWSVIGRPHTKRCIFTVRSEGNTGWLSYATDGQAPKTLNPGGSILSRMLANLDLIQRDDWLFVAEGFFTSARAIQAGFDSVATFGVSLSPTQAALLSRVPHKNIAFVYDYGAGEAGKRNAIALHKALRGRTDKRVWWKETPFHRNVDNKVVGLDLDDIGVDKCGKYLESCTKGGMMRIKAGFSFRNKDEVSVNV